MAYKLFTLLSLFLFVCNISAQKKNPPGTVLLRDNLYIDLSPTTNVDYREYEYCMSKLINYNLDSFKQLISALPNFGFNSVAFLQELKLPFNADSSKMIIRNNDSLPWTKPASFAIFLDHPPDSYFPLRNVSYSFAQFYCEWRSAMVQLKYSASETAKERQKLYKKVSYRLPTQEEWTYALNKFIKKGKISRLSGALPSKNKKKFIVTNLAEIVADQNKIINHSGSENPLATMITFRCICDVEE